MRKQIGKSCESFFIFKAIQDQMCQAHSVTQWQRETIADEN